MDLKVKEIVIGSNCCNDMKAQNLNKYEWLKSIKIGDACFRKVKRVKIDGLNRLKRINIGNNLSTHSVKSLLDKE